MFRIYYDSIQEGMWFKDLNVHFNDARLEAIPNTLTNNEHNLNAFLLYDKPDIILKDNDNVILILERTVEVPSGHNVGQRFGRLVAAAKENVPVVYFGPYMAYKHGGNTAGPRYMNLRLFYSLRNLSAFYNTAVTTINWPVDEHYEVIKTREKDKQIKEYLELFFNYYDSNGINGINDYIIHSDFQRKQIIEQINFSKIQIFKPEQYNLPPDSVEIMTVTQYLSKYGELPSELKTMENILVYNIGMTYIRSDPYAGMSALYYFLYSSNKMTQILRFSNILKKEWYAQRKTTKTYRMFKEFSNAILFRDGLVLQADL